jgi:hypothetical protein
MYRKIQVRSACQLWRYLNVVVIASRHAWRPYILLLRYRGIVSVSVLPKRPDSDFAKSSMIANIVLHHLVRASLFVVRAGVAVGLWLAFPSFFPACSAEGLVRAVFAAKSSQHQHQHQSLKL